MKKIKIIFYPYYSNPYQSQLMISLRILGCNVEKIEPRKRYLFLSKVAVIKPDIFHVHWIHPFYFSRNAIFASVNAILFFLQIVLIKLGGISIVWTAHNLKDHENRFPMVDKFCTSVIVKYSDAVVVHCNEAKKILLGQFLGVDQRKVFVVPHGNYIGSYEDTLSKNEARKRLNIPNNVFVFLFLGMLRPYKGVLELIDTFLRLDLEDARLIVAGQAIDADYARQIESAVEEKENIMFFPGLVPDAKMQEYLSACDVVVFPYRDIFTSGAVILAMSFGCPCIAPKLGCIGEILDENGAFVYDPNHKHTLQSTLLVAHRQQLQLRQMGQYNRKIAEEWDWQFVAELTRDVYEFCLKKSSGKQNEF